MSHIACLCPPVPGHMNPTMALGKALLARGHRVTFIGVSDAAPVASAAGLEFLPIGEQEYPPGEFKRSTARLGELTGLAALRFTIQQFSKPERIAVRDLPALLEPKNIDGMIVDQLSIGASTVADLLQIPYVTLCNALMTNREASVPPVVVSWGYRDDLWGRLRNGAGWIATETVANSILSFCNAARRERGLRSYRSFHETYSSLAQLTQLPETFDFPRRRLPSCFHYVGPLWDESAREPVPFPFERLDDRPLIYASMGTLQNRLPHVYRTIIDACQDFPAQLVLSLGNSGSEAVRRELPDWPIIVDVAPQLPLLRRASLTVTHAGLNTTLESLSNGVPLVAVPITNDQPGVAARIAYAGVGKAISPRRLIASRLRQTITEILSDTSHRQSAQRIQADIAASLGPDGAARIVEQAIETRQPVEQVSDNSSRN